MKFYFLVLAPILISMTEGQEQDFFDGLEEKHEASEISTSHTGLSPNSPLPSIPPSLSYKLQNKPKQISKQNFEPVLDSPSLTNFGSIVPVEGSGKVYQQGNCFGISYITTMWFQDYLQGNIESFAANLKQDANTKLDGVEYIAESIASDRPKFFSKCGKIGQRCRLRSISKRKKSAVKVTEAMIYHQGKQDQELDETFATDNPAKLSEQMEGLKTLIDERGTVFFTYDIFSKSDSLEGQDLNQPISPVQTSLSEEEKSSFSQMLLEIEQENNSRPQEEMNSSSDQNSITLTSENLQWNKFQAGHSMVIYRISEQNAKLADSSERAWRIDFYDSNENYKSKGKDKSVEGYGTYLLYFPTMKKITFSDHMREMSKTSGNDDPGAVQKDQAFLDNTQTRIGITKLWSDHPARAGLKGGLEDFQQGKKTTNIENEFWFAISKAESCNDLQEARKTLTAPNDFSLLKGMSPMKIASRFDKWYSVDVEAIQNLMIDNRIRGNTSENGQPNESDKEKYEQEIIDQVKNEKCSFISLASNATK